jgi:hypothetical protein
VKGPTNTLICNSDVSIFFHKCFVSPGRDVAADDVIGYPATEGSAKCSQALSHAVEIADWGGLTNHSTRQQVN